MAQRTWSILAVAAVVLGLGGCTTARSAGTAQFAVLTQHNDNLRTGAYLNETLLTPSVVDSNTGLGMALRYWRPVNGDLNAQPLYVPRLSIGGIGTPQYDVVFVFTSRNTAYAYDLNDESASGTTTQGLLWSRTLPVTPSPTLGIPMGIQGTPVIDLGDNTVYLVYGISNGLLPVDGWGDGGSPCAANDPTCVPQNGYYEAEFHMAALDIRTGAVRRDVVIGGSVPSAKYPSGHADFVPRHQTQRAGLLLTPNPFNANEQTVYVAFTARWHEESINYHGWVFGYDAATFAPRGVHCTTPDQLDAGGGGGIWQGGAGIAADSSGSLYFTTGNGPGPSINPSNHGNSFVKLTPVLSSGAYSFNVSAYDAAAADPGHAGEWLGNDIDLGAGGVTVIPGSSQLAGGGKTGVMYLMDRTTTMTEVQSFAAFTNLWDHGIGPFDPRYRNWMSGPHMHGAPTYWQVSPSLGYLYGWSEKDMLKRFDHDRVTWQLGTTSAVTGTVIAEALLMPGGLISLSANGTADGVLWITLPALNMCGLAVGRVFAFDALTLQQLWETTVLGGVSHSNPPTIAEGRVIVGTRAGKFMVYGLRSPYPMTRVIPEPVLPIPPDPGPRIHHFLESLPAEKAATLAPPPGHSPLFLAYGKGRLTYESRRVSDRDTTAWVLVDMSGPLTDQSGVMPNMGRSGLGHVVLTAGRGLSFIGHQGGQASLSLEASVQAPKADDAPWTLFRSFTSNEGGLLDAVTFVQRLGTKGGAPPALAREIGTRVDVPYEATYAFYSGAKCHSPF